MKKKIKDQNLIGIDGLRKDVSGQILMKLMMTSKDSLNQINQ
jgi:hypothetical protein